MDKKEPDFGEPHELETLFGFAVLYINHQNGRLGSIRQVLEEKLQRNIISFVFPWGRLILWLVPVPKS
jgi:hypothetical protein